MRSPPAGVTAFLQGRRIAVAGVSRDGQQTANHIYRKLRDAGYDVVPVNPRTDRAEGAPCFPDLASVPGPLDGVLVATHPQAAAGVVRQAADRGVRHVWFHRSLGTGSVSDDAVREARARGLDCVVGGCPMMYVDPVDLPHRCLRWLLRWPG